MMRRALPLAAALVVVAANARAKPPVPRAASARQDFLAAVEAHLTEDNDAAAKDWARCLTKAAKGSDDESDCRLFAGMLQEQLAPNAPVPDAKSEARRAYVEGRDDYLRKDYAGADRRWHDCLGASDLDTASRPDCLMAVELTKDYSRKIYDAGVGHAPSAAEMKAQQVYLEGVIYYQKGDYLKAQKRWTACAKLNDDCRAGLEKLEQLLGAGAGKNTPESDSEPAPEPAPSDAARSAQQTYLEGVIYYQKGDYLKAQKRWTACAELNADCRAGLERIEKLLGSSTAPDEKK
jgi:tetratricopeptide (TPR) repeat protein